MSTLDLERIEAELKAIRKLVEARGDHSTERMAVSVEEAAKMLFCSSRHVQRLIHTGQLLTTPLGSKRMVRIPMSEIRRLTSPAMPELGQPRSSSRRAPTASMTESRPVGRPPKRGFSAADFEAEFKASKLGKKKPKR